MVVMVGFEPRENADAAVVVVEGVNENVDVDTGFATENPKEVPGAIVVVVAVLVGNNDVDPPNSRKNRL